MVHKMLTYVSEVVCNLVIRTCGSFLVLTILPVEHKEVVHIKARQKQTKYNYCKLANIVSINYVIRFGPHSGKLTLITSFLVRKLILGLRLTAI